MPVGVLLSQVSSREITEWEAFARIEPIGDSRGDLRMAILDSLVANANRDPERHPDPFTVMDFLPDFWKKPEDPLARAKETEAHNKMLVTMLAEAGIGELVKE